MRKIKDQLYEEHSDYCSCCSHRSEPDDDCCSRHNEQIRPVSACSCGHCDDDDDDDCETGCSCCGGHESKEENKLLTYGVLAISALSIILGMGFGHGHGHGGMSFYGINVSIIATILCGVPIAKGAILTLIKDHRITTDLLVTIAIVAAIAIGEQFAAAEVAFIMTIGEMLEDYTVKKANKGLSALISYAPKIAHLENGTDIPARELKVGDIVLIKNGESVPVDGIVLEGESSIDQSMVTGESEPVAKVIDDMVFEGTVNGEGALKIRATRSGTDSTLSRMIALVKRAQKEKASTVKITDKLASYIVPISVCTAIAVYLLTGEIVRGVTILVVFCPCSLVLSMPTAIMACTGRATKMGVLIKSGQAVENLWSANALITDKTGTLTHGKMEVVSVIGDETKVLSYAASAEALSSHPIAKAVTSYAKAKGIEIQQGGTFTNVSGKGILLDDIAVGNIKLMNELNIPVTIATEIADTEQKGSQVLYVAKGNTLLGAVAVKDTVRETAKTAVSRLKSMGIHTVMATGDKNHIAQAVGSATGIDDIRSELLPEDKVSLVEELQSKGKRVIMLGDGVNDAPALAKANVGIAMGAIGSDVAIETADIALMNDEISNVPKTVVLAKKTKSTVTVNIIASILLSLFAVIFAGTGDIGPVAGALIHNLGAIVVVLNSILLFYKRL